MVGAGGDDLLARSCALMLEPGCEFILPTPTFGMFKRYAAERGATLVEVPWPQGAWPVAAIQNALSPRTRLIAAVSPNNPTGAVISEKELRLISEVAPGALLLVDLAYNEFADTDLTQAVLALPNALAVGTLSKAWGGAGLPRRAMPSVPPQSSLCSAPSATPIQCHPLPYFWPRRSCRKQSR